MSAYKQIWKVGHNSNVFNKPRRQIGEEAEMLKKFKKGLKVLAVPELLTMRGRFLSAMVKDPNVMRKAMFKSRIEAIDAEFSVRETVVS